MRKQLSIIVIAAFALVATALAPQAARADISAWWLLPAFVAGTWVGATHAYAWPAPYFGPRCWYETRRIRGHRRSVRVCG
jgi:hypothetical protein